MEVTGTSPSPAPEIVSFPRPYSLTHGPSAANPDLAQAGVFLAAGRAVPPGWSRRIDTGESTQENRHRRIDTGESIVDIEEIDTYTPGNRCSTDLLTGVVQHPKNEGRRRGKNALFQTVFSGDFHSCMRVISCGLRERSVQGQPFRCSHGFQALGFPRSVGNQHSQGTSRNHPDLEFPAAGRCRQPSDNHQLTILS
jgi:hypothetical protein